MNMDEMFIRNRITQLRIQKGVSEYKMSYDLGHSRGYINNISSGKALPSLKELLAICDYFNISPTVFFDEGISYPVEMHEAIEGLKQLSQDDISLIVEYIKRLQNK